MEKLVITDVTVEKAIQKGLMTLNITLDQADIVVKEEGKKGLFGFGQKNAVIELSKKEEILAKQEDSHIEIVEDSASLKEDDTKRSVISQESKDNVYASVAQSLENIAKAYGAQTTVTIKETSKKIIFQLESDRPGLLIGKYGKIINALQVLAQTLVYKVNEKAPMVIVNVDDYREKRELKLKEIADRSAKRVLKTKQPIFLEPLPAFERKIIHAKLSEYDYVTTHSEGKEPYRYLVVEFENK